MKNSLYSYLFTCPTSVGPFSLFITIRVYDCVTVFTARACRAYPSFCCFCDCGLAQTILNIFLLHNIYLMACGVIPQAP